MKKKLFIVLLISLMLLVGVAYASYCTCCEEPSETETCSRCAEQQNATAVCPNCGVCEWHHEAISGCPDYGETPEVTPTPEPTPTPDPHDGHSICACGVCLTCNETCTCHSGHSICACGVCLTCNETCTCHSGHSICDCGACLTCNEACTCHSGHSICDCGACLTCDETCTCHSGHDVCDCGTCLTCNDQDYDSHCCEDNGCEYEDCCGYCPDHDGDHYDDCTGESGENGESGDDTNPENVYCDCCGLEGIEGTCLECQAAHNASAFCLSCGECYFHHEQASCGNYGDYSSLKCDCCERSGRDSTCLDCLSAKNEGRYCSRCGECYFHHDSSCTGGSTIPTPTPTPTVTQGTGGGGTGETYCDCCKRPGYEGICGECQTAQANGLICYTCHACLFHHNPLPECEVEENPEETGCDCCHRAGYEGICEECQTAQARGAICSICSVCLFHHDYSKCNGGGEVTPEETYCDCCKRPGYEGICDDCQSARENRLICPLCYICLFHHNAIDGCPGLAIYECACNVCTQGVSVEGGLCSKCWWRTCCTGYCGECEGHDVNCRLIVLTFDANGGSGAPAAQSQTTTTGKAKFLISSTEPTRNGYIFLGWGNSRTEETADYLPNTYIEIEENKTIYAIWVPNAGGVVIRAIAGEGGNITPITQVKSIGQTASITATANTGYFVDKILIDGVEKYNSNAPVTLSYSSYSSYTDYTDESYEDENSWTGSNSGYRWNNNSNSAYTECVITGSGNGELSFDYGIETSNINNYDNLRIVISDSTGEIEEIYASGANYGEEGYFKHKVTGAFRINFEISTSSDDIDLVYAWIDNVKFVPNPEQTKVYSFVVTGNHNVEAIFADDLHNKASVGKYVTYKPTLSSYIPSADETGLSLTQTFNPSSTTKWQIFDVLEDGTVEIISASGVGSLSLKGSNGYFDLVQTLQNISAAYINSEYALSARHLGYSERGLSKFEVEDYKKVLSNYNAEIRPFFPYLDEKCLDDFRIISNQDNITVDNNTWLASRFANDSNKGYGRILTSYKQLATGLLRDWDNSKDEKSTAYVRPIVKLRADVYIVGGSGTNSDPYILESKAESYTITATQSANGSISPTNVSGFSGDNALFTVTPDTGYYVSKIIVDGTPVIENPFVEAQTHTSTFVSDGLFNVTGAGAYPWIVSGNTFKSNNYNKNSSTSTGIINLSGTGILSFDYNVSSEQGYDRFTITLEDNSGKRVVAFEKSGEQSGSFRDKVSGDITITLEYTKDNRSKSGSDMATISNLEFSSGVNSFPEIYELVDINSNHNITAEFISVDANLLTLTYDANGGTGAPGSQSKIKVSGKAQIQISATKPTKSGYEFMGWADVPEAKVAQYQPNENLDIEVNKTIYAVWGIKYTLIYDANGGSDAPAPQSETNSLGSATFTISATKPEKVGYVFMGWAESSDATTPVDYSGGVTVSGTKVLYAVWGIEYTLSYVADGATNVPEPQTTISATGVVEFIISMTTPSWPTGEYSFGGWSLSSTAQTADYLPRGTITITRDTTLYAVKSSNNATYTLIYDANGGINAPAPETKSSATGSAKFTIYSGTDKPTREGYVLGGWSNVSGGAVNYQIGQVDAITLTSSEPTKTIYAVWKPIITYKLIYDANGGASAPSTQTITTTELSATFTISATAPYWPTGENSFAGGWADSTTGTAIYYPGGSITLTSSSTTEPKTITKTIYATWTSNSEEYTLIYDPNGRVATNMPASQTTTSATGSAQFTISTTIPETPGANFTGWNFNPSATTPTFLGGETITVTSKTTILYAIWNPYDTCGAMLCTSCNGCLSCGTCECFAGSGLAVYKVGDAYIQQEVNIGQQVTFEFINTSDRTFTSWTVESGNVSIDTSSAIITFIMPTSNVVIRANYSTSGSNVTYALSYNANGGTGAPSAQSKSVSSGSSATFSISSTKPTRTGYVFAGWSTSSSATSVDYPSSGSITIRNNTTLYAVWTINTPTVTFNANGGSCGTSSKMVTYGGKYGELPTPTRTGYTFNGWYTATSGGTKIESTTNVSITAAQTLYAQWTVNAYTVTFEGNGATLSGSSSKNVTYGSTYGTLPTATLTGYTFNGWYTATSGGTKIEASTTVTITGSQMLYAQWTPNTYTVRFDPNGGTCAISSKTVSYRERYGTLPTPTATGYVFNGWYTQARGGERVDASTTVTITSEQILYAQWTANSYTVSYNANGGSGAPNIQTGASAYTISSTVPTRVGYAFAGWSTSSSATSASYQAGQSITISSNITLYAVWTKLTGYECDCCSTIIYSGTYCSTCSNYSKCTSCGDCGYHYDLCYYCGGCEGYSCCCSYEEDSGSSTPTLTPTPTSTPTSSGGSYDDDDEDECSHWVEVTYESACEIIKECIYGCGYTFRQGVGGGHDYTTEQTCCEYWTRSCTKCDFSEQIDGMGHNYISYRCQYNGGCAIKYECINAHLGVACDEEYYEDGEHDIQTDWAGTKWYTRCTNWCGYKVDGCDHQFENGVCDCGAIQ